jgi:lipopolysaccharide heptosyltransferase II
MRILLVRLRLIGDVVFTTPLIGALRRTYPDAHIAYLVEPMAVPVIKGNPHLNEIIVLPRRSGLARLSDDLSAAWRLRSARFDLAIDLHGGPRAAWLTWASGASVRVGYRIAGRAWMYTHVVPRAPDLRPRHSVMNQWDLLAPLGIAMGDPGRDAVEMPEDPAAAARVERRLDEAGIDGTHTLVVLHVSAGNPFRRWPVEFFSKVVVELARANPNRRFMVTAGPSDMTAVRTIIDSAQRDLGSVPVAFHGEVDLAELRSLVARAGVYIGGDSGPLHIAATTTTPIVALFGPTLPERSMPWRDSRYFSEAVDEGPLPCRPCHQRHCEPGDFRCLTRITPDRVVAAAERGLAFSCCASAGQDVKARRIPCGTGAQDPI